MKQHLFKTAIICSWACFFVSWDPIWGLLGLLAVYCTVEVLKTETSPEQPALVLNGPSGWIVGFLVAGLLVAFRSYGPSYISQPGPFLVILAMFCIWKLRADPRPEEKPEDLLEPKNSKEAE